jgi:hypothetical protein
VGNFFCLKKRRKMFLKIFRVRKEIWGLEREIFISVFTKLNEFVEFNLFQVSKSIHNETSYFWILNCLVCTYYLFGEVYSINPLI